MSSGDSLEEQLRRLRQLAAEASEAARDLQRAAGTGSAVGREQASQQADDAASELNVDHFSLAAGEAYARRLIRAGQFEMDGDPPPENTQEAKERAARRCIARLAMDFRRLLPKPDDKVWDAVFHDLLVARDVDLLVLQPPSSGAGKRRNRPLKAQAEGRIVQAVFEEAGRLGVHDAKVRRRLNIGIRGSQMMEDRKWYRIRNRYTVDQREEFRKRGAARDQPPEDLQPDRLHDLVEIAKS